MRLGICMQSVCTHGFVLSPESLSLESLSINTNINFDSNDEHHCCSK